MSIEDEVSAFFGSGDDFFRWERELGRCNWMPDSGPTPVTARDVQFAEERVREQARSHLRWCDLDHRFNLLA